MLLKKISHGTEQPLQQDKSLIAKIQPQGGIAFNGEKLITTGDGYEIILHVYRYPKYIDKFEPSIESVGRKSSTRERKRQTAATKHDHRDEVFNIAKTISHSDRQLDFVVGRFNSCVGNTMPDG